jgi:uncharacterized protein (TIGR02145 family)/uncharacterized repeat protein (TIGR02543 family)
MKVKTFIKLVGAAFIAAIFAGCGGDKGITNSHWVAPATEFTVEFDTNGGMPEEIPAVAVDSGATLGTRLPENPIKADYAFDGWFDEDGVEYTASTIITKDVTLIAAWVAAEETYTLTVEANPVDGGVVTPTSPQSGIAPETPIEISATANDDYVFVNWELVSGAAVFDDEDDAETTVILSADATIRANFLQVAGTFIDSRDDQTYRWVRMGDQVWMAENLNWGGVANNLGWCYDNEPENCETYGRLYTWSTVMGLVSSCNTENCSNQIEPRQRGICPTGWYVPSNDEWTALANFANTSEGTTTNAGTRLKASSPRWDGTDVYGFSALSGGVYWDADFGFMEGPAESTRGGWWWTATEHTNNNQSLYRRMSGGTPSPVNEDFTLRARGLSLRCIRDDQ